MGNYREVSGDLIRLAKNGEFDVIAHGCNSFCNMGAGIAPQMAKAFGADKFKMEGEEYKGQFNKLGNIDFEHTWLSLGGGIDKRLSVVNAYTQYGYGRNHQGGTKQPLDYIALTMCLRKMNYEFKGSHVGLPTIGCGLGGGDEKLVIEIIKGEFRDCNVTVVIYDGK
tara:strand:+ start:9910 stop:10410 length:501 start_codon:yes stop_codon:yes gene_type:complete